MEAIKGRLRIWSGNAVPDSAAITLAPPRTRARGRRFQWTLWICVGVLLASAIASRPATGQSVAAGLSYLAASQTPSGLWGDPDGSGLRDTTVVLDALGILGQSTAADYLQGIASLQGAAALNNDYLSRQLVSLATAGKGFAVLANPLLDVQEDEESNSSLPNFPAGGWGVEGGFSTDTIDTALALRALRAYGFESGLTVVNESVPVGATTAAHTFNFPDGASGLSINVRATTGAMRLFFTVPALGTGSVDLDPSSVPTGVGIPEQSGTYSMKVQNLAAAPISYSLDVQFTTANGFDVGRCSRALRYLDLAQNPDGGWGIARGMDSNLVSTAEVLLTLERYGGAFVPQSTIDAGLTWLQGHQNGNGGFGFDAGVSTVYETGLVLLALEGGGHSAPAIVDPARTYLLATQSGDGSWNEDPYSTALALRGVAQSIVAGVVTLQGRPARPNAQWSGPLQVTVTPAGQSSPITQFATTTDQNGMFTVTGISPGSYDVRVKGSHTLQNKLTVSLAFGSNTLDAGTLREGDANANNVVNLTDFSILVTTFGKCEGAVGYDARADFNQSGCVTLQDFSLLSTNFGKAGDP